MPGHYSYEKPEELNPYYSEIDSIYEIYRDSSYGKCIEITEAISSKYDLSRLKLIPDVRCMTSPYLIDNIDRSFDVWQNGEWAMHVNFDDFCEYILPYRVEECQIPDNWREYAKNICRKDIDTLHYCDLYANLAIKACDIVNNELRIRLKTKIVIHKNINPVKRLNVAMKKTVGNCDDYTFIATSVLRAKGIPVTIDYTLTTGVEERIFTYENEKQVWW
jgi:hypothetical protein